jgi:hypothetical protein
MKTMPIAVPSEKDLEPEEDVEEGDPEADEPEDLEDDVEEEGPEEDLLESWEADNEHTLYELYGGKEGDSIYVTDQEDETTVLLASDLKELDEAILILSEMRDQVRHRAMLRRKGRLK